MCDLFLSERTTVELRAVSGRLRAASGRLLVGPLVANSLTCLSIRRGIQSAKMMLIKSFP